MNFGIIGYDGKLGSEVLTFFTKNGHKFIYGYSLKGEINEGTPDILIDCSLPTAFNRTISLVQKFRVPLIIATTGLTKEKMDKLKEISITIPIVQSYNYSVGIQILLKLVGLTNNIINDWDIEIIETHNKFKKDKPSGTSELIKNILKQNDIAIHSLRIGDVFGKHIINFGRMGETLSICHEATSRKIFAEGILKSSEFVINKKNGLYNFTNVLFD